MYYVVCMTYINLLFKIHNIAILYYINTIIQSFIFFRLIEQFF